MSTLSTELRVRCFTAFGSRITIRLTLSWPYWLCGDESGSTIFVLDEDLTVYGNDAGVMLNSIRLGLYEMKTRWSAVKEEQNLKNGYVLPRGFHKLFEHFREIDKIYEEADTRGASSLDHRKWRETIEAQERRVLFNLLWDLRVLTHQAVFTTAKYKKG